MPSNGSGSAKQAAQPASEGRQARSAKIEDGQARGRKGSDGDERGVGAATPASELAFSPSPDSPSSAPSGSTTDATKGKSTKGSRDRWTADAERALVSSVKKRGDQRWGRVVQDLEAKGFKRTESSVKEHYRLLETRATAQNVPLDGPVCLNPWTVDEDGRLLALDQLVAERAARLGKARLAIAWLKYASAFPGRGTIDLPARLSTLKIFLKGNARQPERITELKAKKKEMLVELKKQFPELADAAEKRAGGASKKQEISKAKKVVRGPPAAEKASSPASESQAAPSSPSAHSFQASNTPCIFSSPTSDSSSAPSARLLSEELVATPAAVNGRAEVGRSSFSPSPDPLPTPKQPAYLSQLADTSFSTASTSAAPLQPHHQSASSAHPPSPPASALFGTAPAIPSTSSQLSSATKGKKRMREVGDIFEEAKRLCRRAAEALSEEIEDW
ncbi:hypothetical protein JCM10213_002308 [Rhodosporidiobolus nylandii]